METNNFETWILCDDILPEDSYPCVIIVEDSSYPQFSDDPLFIKYPFVVGYDGEDWINIDGDVVPNEVVAWIKIPDYDV